MKKNILSLAATLTLGLALSACSNDSFEDTTVTYPNGGDIALGVYETATNGDYDYELVRTISSTGEPLAYVIRHDNTVDTADVNRMLAFSDTVIVNDTIGWMKGQSSSTFYGDGQNGTSVLGSDFYLAYQNNVEKYTMQFVTDDGAQQFTQTATAKNGFPRGLCGYFLGTASNGDVVYVWFDGNLGIFGDINTADVSEFTWTYNAASGTGAINITGGSSVALHFNSNYQLVADYNGEAVILDPYQASDSEPEKFVPLAYGNYYTFIFDGTVEGCVIAQSEKDDSRYKIYPFIYNEDGMVFEVVDGVPYLIDQFTGYTHSSYGKMYCGDFYQYHGETNTGSFNLYTTGKITFAVYYYVSAGYFGYGEDTFTVTEWMDDATRAKVSTKANKSMRDLTLGNVDLKSNNRTQLQMK